MRAIEVTIQNLIGSGMAPKTENNPYLGFVYTSFQERATKVSHGHTAAEAGAHGDSVRRPSLTRRISSVCFLWAVPCRASLPVWFLGLQLVAPPFPSLLSCMLW